MTRTSPRGVLSLSSCFIKYAPLDQGAFLVLWLVPGRNARSGRGPAVPDFVEAVGDAYAMLLADVRLSCTLSVIASATRPPVRAPHAFCDLRTDHRTGTAGLSRTGCLLMTETRLNAFMVIASRRHCGQRRTFPVGRLAGTAGRR